MTSLKPHAGAVCRHSTRYHLLDRKVRPTPLGEGVQLIVWRELPKPIVGEDHRLSVRVKALRNCHNGGTQKERRNVNQIVTAQDGWFPELMYAKCH